MTKIQQPPWETLHYPEHGFLALANGFTLLRTTGDAAPYASFLFVGEDGGSHPVHETQTAAALLGSGARKSMTPVATTTRPCAIWSARSKSFRKSATSPVDRFLQRTGRDDPHDHCPQSRRKPANRL